MKFIGKTTSILNLMYMEKKMNYKDIILIIFPPLSGIIGSYLTYHLITIILETKNALNFIMSNPNPEIDLVIGKATVGKIVLAMRKDLLGKTNKKADDVIFIDVMN